MFKETEWHEGPLSRTRPNCKGSPFNPVVAWENGEISTEPLAIIEADDPVSCAIYARNQNLFDHSGWKRFKSLVKKEKKLLRMQTQAKLLSYKTSPKHEFGCQTSRGNDYEHALSIDKHNGIPKWANIIKLGIDQQHEYDACKDLGKTSPPKGHEQIRVHFVFDVKHDGGHTEKISGRWASNLCPTFKRLFGSCVTPRDQNSSLRSRAK